MAETIDMEALFKKIDECFDKYTDFLKIGMLPQAYIDSRYNELKRKNPNISYKTTQQLEALAAQIDEEKTFEEKVELTKKALLYPDFIMDKIEKCESISCDSMGGACESKSDSS